MKKRKKNETELESKLELRERIKAKKLQTIRTE